MKCLYAMIIGMFIALSMVVIQKNREESTNKIPDSVSYLMGNFEDFIEENK